MVILYVDMFGFGDNLYIVLGTTRQRQERKKNQDLMTNSVQAVFLAQAYQASAVKKYTTVEDVDQVKTTLEAQFDKVVDSDISGDLRESLKELRVVVNSFLDAERLTSRNVETVFSNITPLRVLAFSYYADDNDTVTQTLSDLNNATNLSFVEVDLRVLTT